MDFKKEIETLFQPLVGQRAWGAKIGWGSFVTIEFGSKRLQDHHYHGDWHLWLYRCDWTLKSKTHELANSESKRALMQAAIDNINGLEFERLAFDLNRTWTEFIFQSGLRLRCQPYPDAEPNEEYWMLFLPDKQVASLVAQGLKYEPASVADRRHEGDSEPTSSSRPVGDRRVRLED